MAKTLTGAGLISYGPLLPAALTTPDGSLFYKTTTTGVSLGNPTAADGPQGLYILSFIRDTDSIGYGPQVAQTWQPAAATDVNAALLQGFPASYFQPADADLLALANTTGTGLYVITSPSTSVTRNLATSGPGLSVINPTGSGGNPTVVMTESGLTLSNLGGILALAKGGTNNSTAVVGGIATGQASSIAYSLAGTAGQVLLSAGTAVPTWANQSTLSVGFATTASFATSATSAASATTAGAISPAHTISLGGVVSAGPTTFDGASNISLTVSSVGLVLRAGDTMSGNLLVGGGGSIGSTQLVIGTGSNTGQIEFKNAAGTRLGYIGNASGVNVNYVAENGATTHNFAGNIVASLDITAFSDLRMKRNVKIIENALDKVDTLRGVTFTRKSDQGRGTGLIAQELQQVLPEAVLTNDDGMLSVAYGNVVGLLVEAIKELRAEVKELKLKLK